MLAAEGTDAGARIPTLGGNGQQSKRKAMMITDRRIPKEDDTVKEVTENMIRITNQ
jgi:hypothetical protein